MMVLIFAVTFFMIRPQQKRQKELVKFVTLEKGQNHHRRRNLRYGQGGERRVYVLVEVDNNVTIRVDKIW